MRAIFVVITSCLMATGAWADDEYLNLIRTTYKRAVVKVEVRANKPVFDHDNNNLCNSEGTAFLVSGEYAVTAHHVLQVDPSCEDVVIMLRSFPSSKEWMAKLAGAENDVALLKFDRVTSYGQTLCSLVVMGEGFDRSAIRFGVPGKLFIDPQGTEVTIGSNGGGFGPLAILTPQITERGESGGPIVYRANVVGILKSRHETYPGYSFMIPNGIVLPLLQKYQVKGDATECNVAFKEVKSLGNNSYELRIDAPESILPTVIFENTVRGVGVSEWSGAKVAAPTFDGKTLETTIRVAPGVWSSSQPEKAESTADIYSRSFSKALMQNVWDAYEATKRGEPLRPPSVASDIFSNPRDLLGPTAYQEPYNAARPLEFFDEYPAK